MKTLYLIRHTTPDIAPGKCYGQLDIELNNNFDEEAAAVLRWLPALGRVISSPLQRSYRLAALLAQKSACELQRDPRLMEMNFGDWEGREWSDISRDEIDAWSIDVLNYRPPNGESAAQMVQRLRVVMNEIEQSPVQQTGLVMHGGSIRALLSLLGDIPLQTTLQWEIAFGAVMAIQLQD